ncbi:MAG: RedY protein [Jatrophihabitantaceae bacterium]
MNVIVHRIELLPGITSEQFERWVQHVDYVGCLELPSVLAFSVHPHAGRSGQYFEVITVTSAADFERDMATPAFGRLARGFEELAAVREELAGPAIPPGYRAC